MGLAKKEKKAYVEGLMTARKIVTVQGVKGLDAEIQKQCGGMANCQFNSRIYSEKEKTDLARANMKDELYILACSIAVTLSEDLRLPNSMVGEFLWKFNDHIDDYRADPAELERASERIGRNTLINKQCTRYLEGAVKEAQKGQRNGHKS